MDCPKCGADARIINKKEIMTKKGLQIKERRECLECARRFTVREVKK